MCPRDGLATVEEGQRLDPALARKRTHWAWS